MGSSYSDDDENRYFDASDEIGIVSYSGTVCPDAILSSLATGKGCSFPNGFQLDVWVRSPESVHDRRIRFFNEFGLSASSASANDFVNGSDSDGGFDKSTCCSGAVVRSSNFDNEVSSSLSSVSLWSSDNYKRSSSSCSGEDGICLARNSDGGTMSVGMELGDGEIMDKNGEVRSTCSVMVDPFEQYSQLSPRGGTVLGSKSSKLGNFVVPRNRVKKIWLKKFHSFSCVMGEQRIDRDSVSVSRNRIQRVKVHHSRKKYKELSALYLGQDIPAHEGSILTMKFSPDGQYLASAGEDGIVCMWQVMEEDRSSELDIPDLEPSCIYLTMNHLSELKHLGTNNEKRILMKTSDSASVVIPPKVFRLLEKPLHEFRGHKGEILDISWSKNNHLLSCSVDNTVRLWQVGHDNCLKVFSHNNYVICAQFNPVDDNYFISGSIDGKVRIWEISGGHVVDWADIKDIVTAVAYRPDGKGGIIGTLTGCCRLYSLSGNNLQLDSRICLCSKKKKTCKRITGFQYFPRDSNKVMVTCADSRIRIIHGTNIIGKYEGPRNATAYISASFTSDGKHIISACEDSNVYVWKSINHDDQDISQVRKINSNERFSTNASVAIPWYGLQKKNIEKEWQLNAFSEGMLDSLPLPSSTCFSRGQDFFLESYPKGSATWPEEKLLSCKHVYKKPSMGRTEYKFLRSSFVTTSSSHAWGLVIVTAGWDGRIRSFVNYGLPAR